MVIQGEGFFKEDASYPLGVKTDEKGKVAFIIDAVENFDKKQKIFIYDKEKKTYHNITKQPFEIVLSIGIFDGRFNLCFKNKKQKYNDGQDTDDKNAIKTNFIQSSRTLKISNTTIDSTVLTMSLFNISGQFITKWDVMDQNQTNIQIPELNLSSGIYITKISTSNGDISKKIILP